MHVTITIPLHLQINYTHRTNLRQMDALCPNSSPSLRLFFIYYIELPECTGRPFCKHSKVYARKSHRPGNLRAQPGRIATAQIDIRCFCT